MSQRRRPRQLEPGHRLRDAQAAPRARAVGPTRSSRSCGPKFAKIPGIRVFLQNPPPIRIGGRLTKSQYQFTLQGADTDELYESAPQLEEKMRELAGIPGRDQRSAAQEPAGQVGDRPRPGRGARRHAPTQIEDALYTAYGSRQVSTIYAPNNQYQVIMELAPEYQRDPAALSCSTCGRESGALVPLAGRRDVHAGRRAAGGQPPRPAARRDASRSTCAGRLAGRSGDAGRAGSRARRSRPRSRRSFQGTAQAFQDSTPRPRHPAHRRDPRDLHRARHPLRELHPPADDPVRRCRSPGSARS